MGHDPVYPHGLPDRILISHELTHLRRFSKHSIFFYFFFITRSNSSLSPVSHCLLYQVHSEGSHHQNRMQYNKTFKNSPSSKINSMEIHQEIIQWGCDQTRKQKMWRGHESGSKSYIHLVQCQPDTIVHVFEDFRAKLISLVDWNNVN